MTTRALVGARFGRLSDAPASFVLEGARLIDPSDGRDEVADLVVVDGRIAGVAPTDGSVELARVNAHGLIAAPGFCDLHTHLRQPGRAAGETVASGAQAAAHGGYTTV
jgi:dihydroorotase